MNNSVILFILEHFSNQVILVLLYLLIYQSVANLCGGRGLLACSPALQIEIQKTDFVCILCALYTSAKISYCNRPFTSTLEFWEIELKTLNIFDQIERPQEDQSCNLSWKMYLYLYVHKFIF